MPDPDGVTILALRLGRRRSVDLDFFSETDEVTRRTRQEIVQGLVPLGVKVVEDVDGNLLTIVSGMHVGFFSYGYRLLEPTEAVCGIALASLIDIGLTKLDALVRRGSRWTFTTSMPSPSRSLCRIYSPVQSPIPLCPRLCAYGIRAVTLPSQ